MFCKLFIIAAVAIASACAEPGVVPAAFGVAPAYSAYSAPLVAAPGFVAPAAYTAGYARVGDSAVVTSHNSQVINPPFAAAAAYTAAGYPLGYAASPLATPLAYTAAASPFAARYVL